MTKRSPCSENSSQCRDLIVVYLSVQVPVYCNLIVWVAESQIHQQYLYSLCSTMPLQYVLLMLTGLKTQHKSSQLCIVMLMGGSKGVALYIMNSDLHPRSNV